MAYGFSTDGDHGLGSSAILFDPSHADRIDITDAELLFQRMILGDPDQIWS